MHGTSLSKWSLLLTVHVNCSVPENIHTPPTEGIGISWGGGEGAIRLKHLKKCMKLNWNFQRGGGIIKALPWGRYGYFTIRRTILTFWEWKDLCEFWSPGNIIQVLEKSWEFVSEKRYEPSKEGSTLSCVMYWLCYLTSMRSVYISLFTKWEGITCSISAQGHGSRLSRLRANILPVWSQASKHE